MGKKERRWEKGGDLLSRLSVQGKRGEIQTSDKSSVRRQSDSSELSAELSSQSGFLENFNSFQGVVLNRHVKKCLGVQCNEDNVMHILEGTGILYEQN